MLKKIVSVLLFFAAGSSASQNLDFRILHALNRKEMPVWDKGMKGLSNTVNPMIPVVVVGIYANGLILKDRDMMRSSFKSAISIGFAALVTTSLKGTINRQRPYKKYEGQIIARTHSGRYSFPSGHTTSAFAMATSISLTYKKWYAAVPAYAYAGFVGYSRMRLGVHFPSDVLGGMVIGIGSGFLVWQLDRLINNK